MSRNTVGIGTILAVAAWCTFACSLAGSNPEGTDPFWKDLQHLAGEMPDPLAEREAWESKDVYYYQSAVTPGILLRMKTRTIRFFTGLGDYGAESPSFAVIKTAHGTRSIERGQSFSGEDMSAPWIVASFQGCRGWEQFDAPWFLALQSRPSRVTLTEDGLQIDFKKEDTGHIFSMPLYGYYKPPQEGNDFAARHNLPSQGVYPWQWKAGMPEKVIERCDWWARVARAYPVGFQESFSVDLSRDEITFRQDYRWLFTEDDWRTSSIRFATLSPSLGLAWKYPGFPMTFSAPIHDPDYFTAFGPFVGALDTNRLEITMRVLQYTNEMEWLEPPERLNQDQKEALDLIVRGMRDKFRDSWRYMYDHGSRENFCWNIVGDVWYPRGLPFVPADLRERAKSSLRIYMANDVLRPHTPFRGKYILVGPGIGTWGGWDDAGKFMTNTLQAIWAYGQFTGDWELIRDRWPLIQKFFITPEEANWITYGRQAIAEIGDEAAPCSAYARMGRAVGDLNDYLFGCYTFARELVHLYVKQRAAGYFFDNQPYNHYEPMPEDVYPTNVWGSTTGWQVDGPTWAFPQGSEHQSSNRWMRFHDPDVGRFYMDHLADSVRRELNGYVQAVSEGRSNMYKLKQYSDLLTRDNPHMMPSLARLQSFLLGESNAAISRLVGINRYQSGWGASKIAIGYSYLRSTLPIRHTSVTSSRVSASPFVYGLQRKSKPEALVTAQEIRKRGIAIEPRWYGWRMPGPASQRGRQVDRSFGRILGDFNGRVQGPGGHDRSVYASAVFWANTIEPSAELNRGLEADETALVEANNP